MSKLELCRERALKLVSQRPHTVHQIRTKLGAKGFVRADVDAVIDDFLRVGLLDDRRVAFDYCEFMKTASPPVGRGRVVAKLRGYGVDPDVIEQACSAVWDAGGEEDEEERAKSAAEAKLRLIRDRSDVRKVREKLYRFLTGKGFSSAVCCRAIDSLQDEP